jgi:signal transduction histidine kinase
MASVGSLAAAIAHEINNPIAAIAGVAQQMCSVHGQRQCGERGAACAPDLMLEQAQRIARITRQIAELTAPQSAQAQLMDVNGLLRRTCNFVQFDPRLRGVEVNLDLDNQLPALHGVPDELTQIAVNLLLNAGDAVAAAPDRMSRITVSTRLEHDHVLITVADNGCGMDALARAHAFDEGYTTKANGSGIGLFMCKSLAEARGGSVDIDTTVDCGTEVRVRLPLQTLTTIAGG